MLSAPALAIFLLLDAAPTGTPTGTPTTPGQDAPVPVATTTPIPRRGLLPALAAVVPGVVIHGSGHFVGGDRRSAARLLAAESIGLSMVVGGIAGLSLTGASRRLVAPFIWLTGAGVATMGVTGLADLYGVTAPPGGWGAPEIPAATTVNLGGLYVRNPTFPYRWLAGAGMDSWAGGFRIMPSFHSSLDGDTLRIDLRVGYRLLGARPSERRRAGNYLDASVGLLHHREGRAPGEFDITVGDVMASGRFGLDVWLPSLAGSFVEGGAGLAIGGYHYGGAVGATESSDALLMRFGFGVYFGRGPAPRGEAILVYDHRHDGFPGGMKIGGLGSGAAGHVGLEGHMMFTPRWGLAGQVQAGSAYVLGLALRWRPSEPRS